MGRAHAPLALLLRLPQCEDLELLSFELPLGCSLSFKAGGAFPGGDKTGSLGTVTACAIVWLFSLGTTVATCASSRAT